MEANLRTVKNRWRGWWVVLLTLALATTAGLGIGVQRSASAQQSQLPSPADLSRTFIGVAKQVKPAVVNIDVVEKSKRSTLRIPEGLQIPGLPPFGGQPRRPRGTGSGVIISADGFILTNNHVAADAEQITVKLADGREFKATRVGSDPDTDLAVIKIDAADLPVARLADSDKLEQGEWVIALGSPFGLSQTMTAGIVSATGRDLGVGAGQFTNYIQTDASINPGNSGGPLVNMQGEVVGINTLIFSQTGTSSGIGFAIPSSLAGKIYGQLVKSGKVTRGFLGVVLQPVSPVLAKTMGFKGTEGALVSDFARDNSPAAKAGLQSGDVIVEFDGRPVKTPKQLTEYVADSPVGKVAQLKYFRDGRVQTAAVSLGERPARQGQEEPTETDEGEPDSGKLGISTTNVTPEVARTLKLKVPSGVVIQNVQPGSPAAEANLQPGDVIHRINRIPITNRQDLIRAMGSVAGETEIAMQIERDGQLSFVSVTLD
jgi:serine protease Do